MFFFVIGAIQIYDDDDDDELIANLDTLLVIVRIFYCIRYLEYKVSKIICII